MEASYLLIKSRRQFMQLTYSLGVTEKFPTFTEFFRNLVDETEDGFFMFISTHVNKKDRILSNCKSHLEQLL